MDLDFLSESADGERDRERLGCEEGPAMGSGVAAEGAKLEARESEGPTPGDADVRGLFILEGTAEASSFSFRLTEADREPAAEEGVASRATTLTAPDDDPCAGAETEVGVATLFVTILVVTDVPPPAGFVDDFDFEKKLKSAPGADISTGGDAEESDGRWW